MKQINDMFVKMPRISVILPCYNHEQYLEERIKSIINQTLPVSQIILLDDASSDESFNLAKKLLSEVSIDVDYYKNKNNSGSPFSQWNKGIDMAKHDFVWIAETDDSCDFCLLEKLYRKMDECSAVLSFSQSMYIDKEGNDLSSALNYTEERWPGLFCQDFCMSGKKFNMEYMTVRNVIPNASAVLFKRAEYIRSGMGNPSMRFCGDWDLWIRLVAQGRVAFIAEELNYFRCHHQTTRARGYTPDVQAEFLACRSIALLQNEQVDKSINLYRIYQLIVNQEKACVGDFLHSVTLRSIIQSCQSYTSLKGVPNISVGVWLLILLIGLLEYFARGLMRVVKIIKDPRSKLRGIRRATTAAYVAFCTLFSLP